MKICKSKAEFLQLLRYFIVEDSWRVANPDQETYSYAKFTGKRSRIDRIYASGWARPFIFCEYLFTGISDHYRLPKYSYEQQHITKGSGLWIFRNKLLSDKEYLEEFKQFWTYWQVEKHSFQSLQEWWDEGKEEIKKLSTRFAASRNYNKNKHIKSLERRLKYLINKSEGDFQTE